MPRKRSSAKRTRTGAKVTRRKNERARERKRKRKKPTVRLVKPTVRLGLVEWLVFISYKKRPRGFHADLLMGSDDGDVNNIAPILAEQARRQLPAGLTFLANWIEGGYAMIAKGKPTNRRFTKVRAFQRYK